MVSVWIFGSKNMVAAWCWLWAGILTLSGPNWGFYAHRLINRQAVFLLPPAMISFYKKHSQYLEEHSVDPDKRRYLVKEEGPRHYIDLDLYGPFPFFQLPRTEEEALQLYHADTLQERGMVPWHIQHQLFRLTRAFQEKNKKQVLQISAELGHYISDAHVPLHASSNHNGQKTNQKGIHGLWESRLPELFAEETYDFIIGKATYLADPSNYIWDRVVESAVASDSVLHMEQWLNGHFDQTQKYGFEERNGRILKQYSSQYADSYHRLLSGMVERRLRVSIFSVASYWYTAWVNAGQPDLSSWTTEPDEANHQETAEDLLDLFWRNGSRMIGREE